MALREPIEHRVIRMHTAAIVCASKGLRLTYGERAGYIGRPTEAGALDSDLRLWARWLHSRGLPNLYSIVINRTNGKPGKGIDLPAEQITKMQAACYEFDWKKQPPPTIPELEKLRD